jgi:flagellin
MSLGVLNNINAVYAANNLNNTNNALSKTLQQLSSGSRINSGADDAAGLSLVNGLQANQQALAQSATNAAEGVGLLQVADGALSQVTSLLNRAVTLATEVSNGTLNGSQKSAANEEYQSILSEISNIGSTTTYNQNKVFGSDVSIVTGDSSKNSASEDTLHIADLSKSTVGATGGSMQYSSGNGTFINLSSGSDDTDLAKGGDSLVEAGTISITSWDAKSNNTATTTITISSGETLDDLVNQINQSGTGVTASFTTANAALGTSGTAGDETGILLTGNVTSNATDTPTATNGIIQISATVGDTTSGQDTATVSDNSNNMAQISYESSNDTSVDLSNTDLNSQSDAEAALNLLNTAISDVSAQDGYVGAQINTLNSISSVLSTQQQNVQSAQNAVQATDYASASSDLSKYEILSQTGISALAQANSLQQEVTKLLQ